jgi:hypothetical protein
LRNKTFFLLVLAAAALLALFGSGAARAHEHPGGPGFLAGPGEWGVIDFVSKLQLNSNRTGLQTDDLIADVAVSPNGNWAFLANWGEPDCIANSEAGGVNAPDAGAYVVDISNLSAPKQVGFIPSSQDSRPGEGMHVVRITTKFFNGDILAMNNELCGFQGKGGLSLWDVTSPRKPTKLSEHHGDRGFADTNEIHSAFIWDAGAKAYAVMTDNIESALTDVDIMDITNPKRPRLIAEYALNNFDIFQPELGLQDSNLHDMVVKKIGNDFIMLLSYWDGGYVQLNVNNPARPVFISDTDYPAVDPELLASNGKALPPEGNGHQAEFTRDNEMFIGTDEDFAPYRPFFEDVDTGKTYFAGEFGWTTPIVNLADKKVNGKVVFGGYGCPESPALPSPSVLGPLAPGEEAIVVLQRGPVGDPNHNYESCFFSQKVEAAQLAGYDAVVIANHHTGSAGGQLPDAHLCGSMGHNFDVEIPGICVGHRAMHELFGQTPNYSLTYAGSEPALGTIGHRVDVPATFDGWGYVWLFDRQTAAAYDTYALPESQMEMHAQGSGDLSVHEVATDPQHDRRAYLSYYAGGMIALDIVCSGAESTCRLAEVGGYREGAAEMGNDFWGVEAFVRSGKTIILGSDRDYGLYIFRRN